MEILGSLNNREEALLIWICISIVWLLTRKEFRKSLTQILRILSSRPLFPVLLALTIYVIVTVHFLSTIGFWRNNQLKDTIIWFFGTAILVLFNIDKNSGEKHYFRNLYFDNLKLLVVIGFIINFYTFSLFVEFFLLPLLLFLTLMSTVAGAKEEYRKTKRLFDVLLSVIGILLIVYTGIMLLTNFDQLATMDNVNAFYLPPLLTLCYLPFLYMIALYINYDSFFVEINIFMKKDQSLAKFVKRKTLFVFRLNLSRLRRFLGANSKKLLRSKTKNEVNEIFNNSGTIEG